MKIMSMFIMVFLIHASFIGVYGQNTEEFVPPGGAKLMVQIDGKDTVLLAYIHDVYVFPRQTFKNKSQEQYFWRTVRDVKKTLPYSKIIASELLKANIAMSAMANDKERKKFLNQLEKDVFKKYEHEMKKMTINQGRMLLKLIDRECEQTSYDLIKIYRGSISAFFWQGVAVVFGSNLKDGYDANDKDKIIERIIFLVEAGQI